MKRFFCVLAVICGLAAVAVTTAAAGGGSGKGGQTITASCTVLGTVTVHASSGASAWVSNTHYVLVSLTGTFTPALGTTGTTQTFTKSYGHKKGLRTQYSCTGSSTDSSGTFSFTATVARTGR
jgi:hypothetical protein